MGKPGRKGKSVGAQRRELMLSGRKHSEEGQGPRDTQVITCRRQFDSWVCSAGDAGDDNIWGHCGPEKATEAISIDKDDQGCGGKPDLRLQS